MSRKYFNHPNRYSNSLRTWQSIAIITVLLVTLSCSIAGSNDQSLQQTRVALEAQMTIMAQQAGQNVQLTTMAQQADQVAQDSQATLIAQQATQLAYQATDIAMQQNQPQETVPPPQVTEPPPVVTQMPEVPPDLDDRIKNAKILLFEDLAGQRVFNYSIQDYMYPTRYVKSALDMGGYSYKDDGSAQGWFKDDLLSSTEWDLILVSSEARTRIQGEYFEYLLSHINRGAGVVLEMWYADDISQGKLAPILSKCGVEVHADWDNPDNLSLYPLIPDDPIFNDPNSGLSLRKAFRFWTSEHGDLLRSKGSGDAQLLAGTIATNKNDHATLVRCVEGRLIIQTFCSHDHAQSEMVPLWENYIYNTLKNKFLTAP